MLEKFFSAYFKPFVVLYVIPTEICFLSLISYQVPFFFFFFFFFHHTWKMTWKQLTERDCREAVEALGYQPS